MSKVLIEVHLILPEHTVLEVDMLLYCTVLYCTYCTVLYCTVLYCTVRTVLYCIIIQLSAVLVKSISIVHHGYCVAAQVTKLIKYFFEVLNMKD